MKEENSEQQELMMRFSIYEQHMQNLGAQIQAIDEALNEMGSLSFGLDEIKNGKGKEIFSPLGRGVFAKTQLISEELLVDVGNKKLINKSIPETKKIIEEQVRKLNSAKKDLSEKMGEIEIEVQKFLEEYQKD